MTMTSATICAVTARRAASGSGGDVAEADRRENRHGEIQGADSIERLRERSRFGPGQCQIGPREYDNEDRDDERHRVGCSQESPVGLQDRPNLVGERGCEQREPDGESKDDGTVDVIPHRHREVHDQHETHWSRRRGTP